MNGYSENNEHVGNNRSSNIKEDRNGEKAMKTLQKNINDKKKKAGANVKRIIEMAIDYHQGRHREISASIERSPAETNLFERRSEKVRVIIVV